MEEQKCIEELIRKHVTFDPTHGLQGVEKAAAAIAEVGKWWECIDDETNDFGGPCNWRKDAGIKKGDKLYCSSIYGNSSIIEFNSFFYGHDITKFKKL